MGNWKMVVTLKSKIYLPLSREEHKVRAKKNKIKKMVVGDAEEQLTPTTAEKLNKREMGSWKTRNGK